MDNRTSRFLREIESQLLQSAAIKTSMVQACTESIAAAAQAILEALEGGHKVLWCGNGGSAAQAQHLSTELVGGLRDHQRRPIPSISLTTDSSLLTAWSNDISFDTVFSRQVEAIGQTGDVLLVLSTSGNSPNIVKAVEVAREKGLTTIVLTGLDGGAVKKRCDVVVAIPSSDTQRIQEGHLAAGHIICELVERDFLQTTGDRVQDRFSG